MSQNINNEGLTRGVIYDTEPEKTYLVLIDATDIESEEQYQEWRFIEGRQKAYDYIKGRIENHYITVDVHKSLIIVNSVKINEGISVYSFMKVMKETEKVIDYTSFDIEDYNDYDPEESEGAE